MTVSPEPPGVNNMWVTEIRHPETGAIIGRIEHGASWLNAENAHGSYMLRYAGFRVHLLWEEPVA